MIIDRNFWKLYPCANTEDLELKFHSPDIG